MYKTKKFHIKFILLRQRIELIKRIAFREDLDETNLINKYGDLDYKSAYKCLFINELQHIGEKLFDENSLSNKGIDKDEFMDKCGEFAHQIIGTHVSEDDVVNHTKNKIEYIDTNIDKNISIKIIQKKDIREISEVNKFYYDNPTIAYSVMRELNRLELEPYNKKHNTNRKRLKIWAVCEIGFNDKTGRKFIVEKRIDGKSYGNTGKTIKTTKTT